MITNLPWIISADDHVLEPPDLWTSRAPARWRDRVPHVQRDRGRSSWMKGKHAFLRDGQGEWCDWWVYEDFQFALPKVMAVAGKVLKEIDNSPTTYDAVRSGCWNQADRLKDMTDSHVEAAIQFPNTLPRFCGQTFSEQKDHELGLFCIQAYNDWLIDDWGGGPGRGRLIPATIVPLWDVGLAAQEVRRVAAMGATCITFSENPSNLGFPSLHTDYWDPLYQECQESGITVCMHIGSGSSMFTTCSEMPFIESSTMTYVVSMGAIFDLIYSGVFDRFPTMKLALSEGQVGWMPFAFGRGDQLWHERGQNNFGTDIPNPPSSYIAGRVFGCVFDDPIGMALRNEIGMEQICYETDYPHADGPFPLTVEKVEDICSKAGLNDDETYAFVRGNSINAFGLERFGIEPGSTGPNGQ